MEEHYPRMKRLKLSVRETRSLLRRTRSATIRRECEKVLEIAKAYLKISQSYENEHSSLREKNVNLARAVQKEKENYTYLLQEKNAADSCFQDLQNENACLKKEVQKLENIIIDYDGSMKNSMIPNLVRLSDDITKFKIKNDIMKKVIESKGNGDVGLPKNSWSNGVNFTSSGNQPVSTVNPMVKGYIIQKPTINVRRVSIPNENRLSLFANVDIASPIYEEAEDDSDTVTSRNRKCKNGLRHVINISNAPVGSSIPSATVPEMSFRDIPSEFTDEIDIRMEPTVLLSDVTRLLQNSSYRISEPTSGSPVLQERFSSAHNNFTPGVVLKRAKTSKTCNYENETEDNPLEGSSQMYRRSPSPQFERTPSRVSPAAQHHDSNCTETRQNDSIREKSDRNSTRKENPLAESHEYVEKHETLFPASPAQSAFSTKHKESCFPRVSNAVLNESSAPTRENILLSSTLNSAKKRKFFTECDGSSSTMSFTTRRKLPRCAENTLNSSPPISEDSFLMKPVENIESRCSNNMTTVNEVSTSNIPDDEPETKKSSRKSNQRNVKRNIRNKTKKEAKPQNTADVENLSPIEKVRDESPLTRNISIKLENCVSNKRKMAAKNKPVTLRKTKSISYDSDSSCCSNSTESGSECSSSSDHSLLLRRSTRRRNPSISYKEPDLGRKLRR